MRISLERKYNPFHTASYKYLFFFYIVQRKMMDEYTLIVCPGKCMLDHHKLYEIRS